MCRIIIRSPKAPRLAKINDFDASSKLLRRGSLLVEANMPQQHYSISIVIIMMSVRYEDGCSIGSGGLINGGGRITTCHVMVIDTSWYMKRGSGGRRPQCPQSRDGSLMVCTACGCKGML